MRIIRFIPPRLLTAALTSAALFAGAQTVGVKSNLLYDAALSPNIGVEVAVAPKWSVEVSGNFNNWAVNDHKWKHWFVQPEARYWLCESLSGHFFAVNAIAGEYNVGNISGGGNFLGSDFSQLADKRYEGFGIGLGIGYGYTWMLNKHWSIEAELTAGWIYTRYDVYPCTDCGRKLEEDKTHHYVGPTKTAVNLIYVF